MPYSFIDGGGDKKNYARMYDYNLASLDSVDINRRSMISPYFRISLNTALSGGVVSVSGQITALRAVSLSDVTLYLVVTQKKNTGPAGVLKRTVYYNIFRKFIPDAGGIQLKKSWTKNEVYNLSEQTWPVSNIPAGADIEVIAFLQNNLTKEIYQAASVISPDITVGINNLNADSKNGFELYPNPASSKLTVIFENPIKNVTDIRIYDFSGALIKTFKTGTGISEFVIDDLGLKNGIYLVRISSGGADTGFKKLIVTQR